MIIETIKRLSIDMFIAIMAIEAIVIAAIAAHPINQGENSLIL